MKNLFLILFLAFGLSASAQTETFTVSVRISDLPNTNLIRVVTQSSLVVDGIARRVALECSVKYFTHDSISLSTPDKIVILEATDNVWLDSTTGNISQKGATGAITQYDYYAKVIQTGKINGQYISGAQLRVIGILKADALHKFD